MEIKLVIKDREIIPESGYVRPSEGDVGTVRVSFDIQDTDFDGMSKRVTFASKGAPITVDYADVLDVPHEALRFGGFFVTLTGYNAV